ncbi:MAG: methionine ABC transporter ATP-binding protein [Chlamydiia bacterium]|nr:methionine ABC transporter ATP-binding protein [Chlamydiia bacterium]
MNQKTIVSLEGVTRRYHHDALRGIDLQIQKGEIFGIIGGSGAGKSTLLNCIAGLESPTMGRVMIEGVDVAALSKKKRRVFLQNHGMIFQHFNLLLSRTALGNVLFPLEIARVSNKETKAMELLSLVGLLGKERAYPAELSGGEKQRVAIARALANDPKLLLCDEATSALDPLNTQSILELLNHLNQKLGITIIMITHEMEVIKQICHRVAVLEKGKIVEKGRVADLFASPEHAITKQFLQVCSLPSSILNNSKKEDTELLRLIFREKSVERPIISSLVRRYAVDATILLGAIDALKEEIIGNLIVEISGQKEEREKALHFLTEEGIDYERIG